MKALILVFPVSLLCLACAGVNGNLSACSSLRHNHEQISRIEKDLAALESEPAAEKRDRRMAYLEKRRRMYLEDNDRQKPDCRPLGK